MGTLKINVDGAWDNPTNEGGVGLLIRDSNGSCNLASSIYTIAESALTMEILAIKSAFYHIHTQHHEGTCHWIIELDSQKAMGLIIDDVKPTHSSDF